MLGALPLIVVESGDPDVSVPLLLLMGLPIVVTCIIGSQQHVLSLAAPAHFLERIGPVAAHWITQREGCEHGH